MKEIVLLAGEINNQTLTELAVMIERCAHHGLKKHLIQMETVKRSQLVLTNTQLLAMELVWWAVKVILYTTALPQ